MLCAHALLCPGTRRAAASVAGWKAQFTRRHSPYFTKWHYLVVNVLVATILCGYSNQMCKAHLTMEWHQAMTFAKCCAKKCLGTQQEKYLKKPKYKDAPKPQYERERKMKGLYSRSAWLNVGQLFEVCRLEFPLKHTHICTINLLAGCLTNSCHSIL